MKNRGTIISLVWLNRGETDPNRYETFTCPSALYEKYTAEELGIAKGTFVNVIGKLDDAGTPIIYTPAKNPNVRFIKSVLYGK